MVSPICAKTAEKQTQITSTMTENKNVNHALTKGRVIAVETKELKLSNLLVVLVCIVDTINVHPH